MTLIRITKYILMKYIFISLLAFVVFPGILADVVESKYVSVLTADTLHTHIASSAATLVVFHAPWCGHCKQLVPIFGEAAEKLSGIFPDVSLATLDADAYKDVAQKFHITGFPSLRWFVGDSKAIEYDGERNVEAIIAWVRRQLTVQPFDINSGDSLDSFLASAEISLLVGLHQDLDVADEDYKLGDTLAKSFEFPVGVFKETTIWEHLGAQFGDEMGHNGEDLAVFMFRRFDKSVPIVRYHGDIDVTDIKKFVNINILPDVVHFSENISKYVFASPVKKHIILFSENSNAPGDVIYDSFHKNAVQSHGDILSIVVDDSSIGSGISSFFSVLPTDRPCIFGAEMVHGSSPSKFKGPSLQDGIDDDSISSFFEGLKAGTMQKHVKSQNIPIPEKDSSEVPQLNVETFAEIEKSSKSFLVLFYSPGCGHCVAMHPIWDKLYHNFQAHATLTIAKIDVTANDLPPKADIKSFPTIKLFTPGNDPITFDGTRTAKGLRKFLNINGFPTPSGKLPDTGISTLPVDGTTPGEDKLPDSSIAKMPVKSDDIAKMPVKSDDIASTTEIKQDASEIDDANVQKIIYIQAQIDILTAQRDLLSNLPSVAIDDRTKHGEL
jgi:protein disulfide isomerase